MPSNPRTNVDLGATLQFTVAANTNDINSIQLFTYRRPGRFYQSGERGLFRARNQPGNRPAPLLRPCHGIQRRNLPHRDQVDSDRCRNCLFLPISNPPRPYPGLRLSGAATRCSSRPISRFLSRSRQPCSLQIHRRRGRTLIRPLHSAFIVCECQTRLYWPGDIQMTHRQQRETDDKSRTNRS